MIVKDFWTTNGIEYYEHRIVVNGTELFAMYSQDSHASKRAGLPHICSCLREQLMTEVAKHLYKGTR